MENRASVKRKFIFFSAVLFLLIVIGGSIVFIISMQQIVHENTGHELLQAVEIERIKLEASVNSEISIALKMATSPLLVTHFLDPADTELTKIAFAEIEGYRKAFRSQMVFWASDIDKEFYFDVDNHYTIDPNNSDNYWYKMTLYETEKYNFNINYNPEIKKIMLWINAPVFDTKHTPIGLVGTGIDVTEFVDSIYKNYKHTGELYFFNSAGEITGAADTKLITNKEILDKALGSVGAEILGRAKQKNQNKNQYFKLSGKVIAMEHIPALDWFITAIQPLGLADILKSGMTILFAAMVAVIAAIFVIFYMFISNMLKPLQNMVKILNQISTDWDMTRRFQVRNNDEIGTLGSFFNLTFEKIRELLVGIKSKTVTLSDTGDQLSSYMAKTTSDIEGINGNIQEMRGQVLSQSDKVNAAANSMGRIINDLDSLNNHISIQAESVTQSSAAIEEMLANIQSVTQTLIKNSANINSLAESSEAGRADLEKVSTDIREIAQESEGLLEINSVMQNIASQTNLLSMNASIEAAHAGESGKGFAVVADEIFKLAENSGKQSKTISVVLKKIKSSIDKMTKSTSIVLERFGNIEKEVQTVSNQESQIRNAMEEQGTGSRQILEAITRLNSITDQVRKESADMATESREAQNQSTALKKITAEVAGSMDMMSQNSDEISTVITRVQEISKQNKENIGILSADIARFKVEE